MQSKRGGKRVGAGRPKGTGKYGVSTKVCRVPSDVANFESIDRLLKSVSLFEETQEILLSIQYIQERFALELDLAKEHSSTGTYPRTWDKARKILEELKKELSDLPIII